MSDDTIAPAVRKFILHWGELGTRWGLNRSVAQVHALLYVSKEPLDAERIAASLSLARSNVSVSLRELQGWGVVRVVHTLGDRRDRFEAIKDVHDMFSIILEERKRREIDPTLAILRECAAGMKPADGYARDRVSQLLGFFEDLDSLYTDLRRLPPAALRQVMKLRGKLKGLLA